MAALDSAGTDTWPRFAPNDGNETSPRVRQNPLSEYAPMNVEGAVVAERRPRADAGGESAAGKSGFRRRVDAAGLAVEQAPVLEAADDLLCPT